MDELMKALLEKAGHKSLAAHFKKVASHHEAKADHHEKIHKAHTAMAEHHDGMADTDEVNKKHHKAKHQFHKTVAGHHEKAAAHHTKMAAHYNKVAEAHDSMDAEKIAKAWEFELEKPVAPVAPPAAVVPPSAPVAPVVKAEVTPTPTPEPAKPENSGGDSVDKAVEQKLDGLVDLLTKFLEKKEPAPAAPPTPAAPVKEPTAVEKKLDAVLDLLKKAVEAPAPASTTPSGRLDEVQLATLAALTGGGVARPKISVNTPDGLKVFAVPRTGDISKAVGTSVDSVPDELKDLVTTTHSEE